jgi:putative lipoic acid-binding regulatory protein
VVKLVQNTKFDEYLEFPCRFSFRVMGLANKQLTEQVIVVMQRVAPGDYTPTVKPSTKGNYESVHLVANVTSKEHIEQIYNELGKLEDVRHVL